MKVKLGHIVESRGALMDLRMAKKPSWMTIRLARMGREVDEVLGLHDKEVAEKFKEFGTQIGQNRWEIAKENRPSYLEWMRSVLEEEVDIALAAPIKYSDLMELSTFQVSEGGLASLGWLLVDDTAEPIPAPAE